MKLKTRQGLIRLRHFGVSFAVTVYSIVGFFAAILGFLYYTDYAHGSSALENSHLLVTMILGYVPLGALVLSGTALCIALFYAGMAGEVPQEFFVKVNKRNAIGALWIALSFVCVALVLASAYMGDVACGDTLCPQVPSVLLIGALGLLSLIAGKVGMASYGYSTTITRDFILAAPLIALVSILYLFRETLTLYL